MEIEPSYGWAGTEEMQHSLICSWIVGVIKDSFVKFGVLQGNCTTQEAGELMDRLRRDNPEFDWEGLANNQKRLYQHFYEEHFKGGDALSRTTIIFPMECQFDTAPESGA